MSQGHSPSTSETRNPDTAAVTTISCAAVSSIRQFFGMALRNFCRSSPFGICFGRLTLFLPRLTPWHGFSPSQSLHSFARLKMPDRMPRRSQRVHQLSGGGGLVVSVSSASLSVSSRPLALVLCHGFAHRFVGAPLRTFP